VPNVMEIWESKPPVTLWATQGLLRDSFIFTFTFGVITGFPRGVNEISAILACHATYIDA